MVAKIRKNRGPVASVPSSSVSANTRGNRMAKNANAAPAKGKKGRVLWGAFPSDPNPTSMIPKIDKPKKVTDHQTTEWPVAHSNALALEIQLSPRTCQCHDECDSWEIVGNTLPTFFFPFFPSFSQIIPSFFILTHPLTRPSWNIYSKHLQVRTNGSQYMVSYVRTPLLPM